MSELLPLLSAGVLREVRFMSDDAGFAVALTLRQQLLQNSLLIAYANGAFPRTLNTATLPGGLLPGGPPDVGLDVFLGPPTISRCGVRFRSP
jgi:hypothetical protein